MSIYGVIRVVLLTSFQIADPDRKISTLYDMLDEQDATNRDAKGLPFTVRVPQSVYLTGQTLSNVTDTYRLRHRSQENHPLDYSIPRIYRSQLRRDHSVSSLSASSIVNDADTPQAR